jgi:hypothetical protein
MKGIYRVLHIAKEAGLSVRMPAHGEAGILWVSDGTSDIVCANVSRRGAITSGNGWTPVRQLVFFKGRDKDVQVCNLLQMYDPTLKQVI